MSGKKAAALIKLKRLWVAHDLLERRIIQLERLFTDRELDRILER
jgi:hypothetical protein